MALKSCFKESIKDLCVEVQALSSLTKFLYFVKYPHEEKTNPGSKLRP